MALPVTLTLAVALLTGFAYAFLYFSLAAKPQKLTKVENLAVFPNFQGPRHKIHNFTTVVDWIEVTYPANGSFSAADVNMEVLNPRRGVVPDAWRGARLGQRGALLTGRLFKGSLYVLTNQGHGILARGCCADTVRIFPSSGGHYKDVRVDNIVRKAVNTMGINELLGVSHSFHPLEMHGSIILVLIVLFREPGLNGTLTDGFLALNMDSLKVHPTADGDMMWIPFRAIGTLAGAHRSSIFRVQYKAIDHSVMEEWHANGVLTFTTGDGTNVMAFSQRMDVEAVLVRNPFLHTRSEGGGRVLQRFGSPRIFHVTDGLLHVSAGHHNFGIRPADSLPIVPGRPLQLETVDGGVHNIFFYRHADGRETLTMFCNEMHGANQSGVFEFDIKLVKDPGQIPTDAAFDTNYTKVVLPFVAMAQGGARPLGNGVYIVASGLADRGYVIADTSGGIVSFAHHHRHFIYDPFTFITYIKPASKFITLTSMQLSSTLSSRLAPFCAMTVTTAIMVVCLRPLALRTRAREQELIDTHYSRL